MGISIEGKLVLTEEDMRRGIGEMSEQRRARGLVVAPIGALLLMMVMKRTDGSEEPLSELLVSLLIPAGLIAFLTLWVGLFGPRRIAARQLAQMREGEREQTFTFDDEGVQIKNQNSSARFTYQALHRFVEGRTSFLLYGANRSAHVVPKRAFVEADLPVIRELLAKHVTPRPSTEKPVVRVAVTWVILVVAFLALWQLLSVSKPH